MLATMTGFRLAFMAVNRDIISSIGAPRVLFSLLNGIRFDLHAVLFILAPFFLVLHVPGKWKFSGAVPKVFLWIPLAAFLPGIMLWLIDIHYYTEAGRHLSYEVFLVGGEKYDLGATLKMIAIYRWSIVVFFTLAAMLLLAWKKVVNGFRKGAAGMKLPSELLWLLVFLLFVVGGLKGTLTGKPLRMSDAFIQGRTELGHLTLNPLFTVGRSLIGGAKKVPEYYPEEEALRTVRGLLGAPDTKWDGGEQAPLLRRSANRRSREENRYNVVVLVLESWSARYVGAYGGGSGVTPEFDRLAGEGLLFSDFYAVGNRTIEGLAALCLGIPSFNHFNDMTKGSFLSGSLEQNRYRGIGAILADSGYSSVYVHGESSGTFRQSSLARLAGFQEHLGREELQLEPDETDGSWGGWDHVMLARFLKVIKGEREPFLAVWMSLTNHPPYSLPDDRFKTASPGDADGQFMDSIRYTDYHLGRFFEKIRKEDFFGRTIFVITADHSARNISTMGNRYRVPFLVYAPGIIGPGVNGKVGSQLGFIPTILDLLGLESDHHAMGNSLFDDGTEGFAFLNFSQGYGWVSGGLWLEADPDGSLTGAYDSVSGESFQGDVSGYGKQLRSFLQVGSSLLLGNRFEDVK